MFGGFLIKLIFDSRIIFEKFTRLCLNASILAIETEPYGSFCPGSMDHIMIKKLQ